MLIDHRTYTVRAGALRKQLALYEKHGLAHQKRHFGEPLAWLVSETGDVNSYVHIWVYEDAEDRNRKRAALFKDPEWLKYIEMNAEAGYLIKDAIERSGIKNTPETIAADRKKFRDAFATTSITSPIGQKAAFTADREMAKPGVNLVVKNGQFVLWK